MIRKNMLSIIMLCIITTSTVSVYADTYVSHIEVSKEDFYFTAGRQNNLTLVLNNGGGYDVFEVEAILTSNNNGITILSNAHKVINKINYNQNITYQAIIDVDQSVPLGAYVLQMQLKYLSTDIQTILNVPISIVVNEAYTPWIKINTSAESAKLFAGYEGDFIFTVENVGEAQANNINISVTSASQFISIIEGQKIYIGNLTPGEKVIVKTKMRIQESTALGPYNFVASVNFDSEGMKQRQSSTLPFEVISYRNPILVIRNMNPGLTITPGMDFKVSMKITCNDAAAFNVKAQMGLDQKGLLAPLSSTTISLEDMAPGESADVSYDLQIDGNAAPGQLPVVMTLTYLNSKGIQMTSSEVVALNIDEFVSFRLLKEQVFTLEQGKIGKIDSDLLLVGLTRVEFTSINIVEGTEFNSTVGSSEYLGAIDPDSPVPFTLLVEVSPNATLGENIVHTKVSYLDQRNVFREKPLDLTVEIVKPSVQAVTSNDGGFWGWLRSIFGL